MFRLAWDFFLSFSIRAVFTLALCGGVNLLVWIYGSWRAGDWKDEPHLAHLWFVLAGVTALVGLMGTFRRGKTEANFSVIEVAAIVAGGDLGHVHAPSGHAGGRTLRRFPSLENLILGSFLIALWLAVTLWKEETWVLRNGAFIGGGQIIWAFLTECFRGIRKRSGHNHNEDSGVSISSE